MRRKLSRTEYIMALGGLAVGALAMAFDVTVGSVHAESSSANASVTVANTISLTLTGGDLVINNLTPGNASDSNVITASVTSNSPYGFHLSATTGTSGGTTSLVNTADSNFTFTNLNSNKAALVNFSDNTWGYSYSTDGTNWISGDYGVGATAGYNGLPLDGNDNGDSGVVLFNSDSYLGSKSVQFKIGAKSATTQAAGTYTNTVNFYVVTNPKPPVTFDIAYADAGKSKVNNYYTLQDATLAICSEVDQGQIGQVIDTRDNTVYHIGKLADDNCWMLDNLALDLTDASVQNNLTANTTNASNTTLGYLKNGGGISPYTANAVQARTKSGTGTWNDSCTDPYIATGYENDVPSDVISTAGGFKVGTYYNYCAASAGSYCYGCSSSVGDTTEDICPKGWRMPTGNANGEYSALAQAVYGSTGSTSDATAYTNYRNALSLPLSGYFVGLSDGSGNPLPGTAHGQGSNSFWWASNRDDNLGMHGLYVNANSIVPDDFSDRYDGNPIRCLLDS